MLTTMQASIVLLSLVLIVSGAKLMMDRPFGSNEFLFWLCVIAGAFLVGAQYVEEKLDERDFIQRNRSS